jgi:hypothetical protein
MRALEADARSKALAFSRAAPKALDQSPICDCRSWGKIIVDYVIRRPNALSAGLKNRLKGLTFAETPLSAISRFTASFGDI